MKRIWLLSLIIFSLFFNITIANADVKFSKNNVTIGINNPTSLTVIDDNGNIINNITWKSSNNNIATVNNGIVNGKNVGKVLIMATVEGKTLTCTVSVINNYINVIDMNIKTKALNLLVGETKQIIYELIPSDATNKEVIFSSEDNKIATVDSKGNVKGISDGTTNIILKTESFFKKVTINVTSTISLKSISIDNEIEIDEMAEKTLTVSYNPTNATNKKVTWKSDNQDIASVDSNGKIVAKKPGETTITVTSDDGGYTSKSKVIVKEIPKNVTEIKLNKEELKLEKGEETTLEVIFTPTYAIDKEVSWKSSNSKVVKVNANGKLTAVKAGNATITATSHDGNYTATCKVTVSSLPIEKIEFKEKKLTVYLKSETNLETIATPEDSAIENAIWKSSNEEVATVTDDGKATALSIGTTTISISNQDGSISDSMELTVIEKPPEPFNITIEGYELNFNPDTMQYNLKIKNEKSLKITTNYEDNVVINGNKDLQDGSIITVTYKPKSKSKREYVITISKNSNYTIYFISIISLILLINIIRIITKGKKKKRIK